MKKWNLLIDVAKCHNSQNCFLSVADEYQGNTHPGYAAEMPRHGHRWIDTMKKERGQAPMVDVAYVSTMCMHCDDAPCIPAAKNNAVKKRDDGIVIIDPELSKGQKHLVDACPHGAIWWNEELEIPQHWNFDAHLLDNGWKEPRCAQACPTGALKSLHVEDSEMEKIKEEQNLEEFNPQFKTKPRVYYKNLHLYNKCFIGGTVVFVENATEDCLEDANIVLKKEDEKLDEVKSDTFGEFKFDGLDPNSGSYQLEITHDGFLGLSVKVELKESIYTGIHTMQAR